MIIIKIIILHVIQIRHNNDFPSTGTRLVQITTLIIIFMTCKGNTFHRRTVPTHELVIVIML